MTLSDLTDKAKSRALDVALRPVRKDMRAESEYAERERHCRPYTMTSPERLYALHHACRYVVEAGIPGDFVECGVWKGGSSMMMALELVARGEAETARRLHMFDTFTGMAEPQPSDGEVAREEWSRRQRDDHNEWCYAPEREVLDNVLSTGIAAERVHTVAGKVEETIPEHAPESIALLRLDTDWYESTRHELEHLYPRLSERGVLVIDDYGHWQGARRAVDEYFEGQPVLLQRIDYTGRMMVRLDAPGEA